MHNVRKLRVICIDDEMLTFGSDAMDTPGYDLLALMNGSEGLLGIIVEVTVNLLPIPPSARVMLAAFDDAENAGKADSGIIASGIIPAGLEMMDNLAIRAAEDFVHAGYPKEAAAILQCELDGTKEEVCHNIDNVRVIMQQHNCSTIQLSSNEEQRLQLWVGGTITGEHGVGSEKIDEMCVQFKPWNCSSSTQSWRHSTGIGCSTPARSYPNCTAAQSLAPCMFTITNFPFPNWNAFDVSAATDRRSIYQLHPALDKRSIHSCCEAIPAMRKKQNW